MSDVTNGSLNIPNLSDASLTDPGSRVKIKKEWSNIPRQKYVGDVLHGNLHGPGFYFIEEGEKLFYDGLFYANKLEGYAQVFYNDASNFQGLFKNNVRFGPGVFTYPNGEQDVGLWSGLYLLRLGSLNQHNSIPRLASTSVGQLKLLKYKYLVPVCPKRVDVAYDILQRLGANESILRRSDELYNVEVENKHNMFFKKNLFNEQFYKDLDLSIDVALTEEEKRSTIHDSQTEIQALDEESLDANVERIERIMSELENIESKLKAVTEQMMVIQKKVEYCRECCYIEQRLEESFPGEGEYDEPEITSIASESMVRRKPSVMTRVSVRTKASTRTKASVATKASRRKEKADSFSIEDLDTEGLFTSEETLATFNSSQSNDASVESQSDSDVMSQIEQYLINTCGCNEAMYVEDLYALERELESITRDVLFFESIRDNLKVKLEKHLEQIQDTTKVRTKKVTVNEVLSWNNERYCTRMLRHSFLHRRSEYLVNFKVSDLIAGNRAQFRDPGPQERNCTDFLVACSLGDIKAIYKHIQKNLVNVNVCDAKGNNGVFFAAKNNHREAIKVLVNLGAKLDQQNDEGLLPLSICILTILALQHKVENWEGSFLPKTAPAERTNACRWYPNMSLLNLLPEDQKTSAMTINSTSTIKSRKIRSSAKMAVVKPYLFDTSFVTPSLGRGVKSRENLIQRKMSFGPATNASTRSIEDTIKTLLRYGANPDASGSPLPPLFLSLFTNEPNLVESLLAANTDVNITIDDDMTSLHVIASSRCTLANVRICHLLIFYDCDPRLKTSPNHWKKQKMEILGKHVDPATVEDLGKNPLHILCIRRDFNTDQCSYFFDMVMNFRDSFVDFNERYLGHTPLSLAVLVGNKKLVGALMNQHVIDPHQLLDYNMGNVATIYILKRYEDLIPPNAAEILKYLAESGVNILTPVGDFENAIEFMEKEHKGSNDKQEKYKTPEDDKSALQKNLIRYIKDLGRDAVIKCIQLLAVENLYNLVEDDFVRHKCVSILSEYLTPSLAVSNLQLLFNHGKIKPERFDRQICLKLVNIVKKNFNKQIEKEWNAEKRPRKNSKTIHIDATDYGFILNLTDFTRMQREKLKVELLPPGLDDPSKYKVCFHCLRNRNKELLVCPRCQLIHFCSATCNKENLRLNLHPCNTHFYASELARIKSPHAFLEPENLTELYRKIRESCEKRRVEKLQSDKESKRKQFEEEMKSDTYGTKLLRRVKHARTILWRTSTTESLMGSFHAFSKMETIDHDNSIANKTYSGSIRWDLSSKELLKSYPERTRTRMNLLDDTASRKDLKTYRKEKLSCSCKECTEYEIDANNITCKCPSASKKPRMKIKVGRETEDANVTPRKLQVLPPKYQEFVRLLTEYFPDVNFSSLLLPYACYSNGHLYYRFLNDDRCRTYSMM